MSYLEFYATDESLHIKFYRQFPFEFRFAFQTFHDRFLRLFSRFIGGDKDIRIIEMPQNIRTAERDDDGMPCFFYEPFYPIFFRL